MRNKGLPRIQARYPKQFNKMKILFSILGNTVCYKEMHLPWKLELGELGLPTQNTDDCRDEKEVDSFCENTC